MTDYKKAPVTVLGLGQMGIALVNALVSAGHPTTVWNRTPGKAVPGAVEAATAAEAIEASRLVIVCLLDAKSVTDVLDTAKDVLAGRVVVNLTTNTPSQGRDLAERYEVDFLDGGIMAVPPMIGTPASMVLYSGSRSAFDTNKAVFDLFGESVYVGDDPGFAALYDLSLLSGMYGAYMGIIHAFAMITSAGMSATSFAPMLIRWMTGMTGGLTEGAAEQIDKRDYSINVVSTLAMQTAAFGYYFDAAADQGISPELIAPVYPLMQKRVADGHGHEDFTGIIELIRKGSE